MRVQGKKQRVVLRAEDMEPSEGKPTLRIAPIAAVCVWLCSTLIATAIYFEWLPARALFESEPSADVRPERGAAMHGQAVSPAQRDSKPLAHRGSAGPANKPGTADSVDEPAAPARVTKTESKPEPARVIRGSYHSDTHWAAGW